VSLEGESSGHEAPGDDISATPPMSEWSDGALARGVELSRIDAFTELRRRHLVSVTAVARMILGNRSSCEDVVAEVFVGFWLAPEKFDAQRGTVLAYLRLMARGRSIDLIRSDTARRRREVAKDVGVQDHDADAAMIDAEAAGELRAALALLPADERTPIELAFFRGMTYDAVARQLGLPEGTVKSRIRRGLRRLELSENLEVLRTERGSHRDDQDGEATKSRAGEDASASVES
jgi:RNA polymerase sigma-70 factor (ECF subfamily)